MYTSLQPLLTISLLIRQLNKPPLQYQPPDWAVIRWRDNVEPLNWRDQNISPKPSGKSTLMELLSCVYNWSKSRNKRQAKHAYI